MLVYSFGDVFVFTKRHFRKGSSLESTKQQKAMETKNSPVKMEPGNSSNTFDKVLSSIESFNFLPLVHSVDCFDGRTILDNQSILPTDCDVFEGEKLVYLFYGIPNYRVSQGIKSRGDKSYLPMCFVLKNVNCSELTNIFPFDSGAFHLGKYSRYLHKRMNLYDFSLPLDNNYITRFVATFYSSNQNYYLGICKKDLYNLDYDSNLDYHLASYINMLLDVGEQDFDSRSRTIEMISKKAIDLNHSLFAVICPKSFRRANTELLAAFKARGVFIHEYEVFYGDAPESYNTIIKTILFELYKQNNVL